MSDTIRSTGRPSPDRALELLMTGNQRYVAGGVATQDLSARNTALAKEHAPIAAILGCGDARVGAELIFDRGPGDLFMVRVAGNFLSDYGLASFEFCVEFLNVPLLMVLGHTHCGAVSAAVDVVEKRQDLPGRLFVLIDALEPSVLRAKMENPSELVRTATEENVRRQVRRLETISPVINAAREAGRVKVVGAIYDVETGQVNLLE